MNHPSPAALAAASDEIWRTPSTERVAAIQRLALALGVSFRYLRRSAQRHHRRFVPAEPAPKVEIVWPAYNKTPIGACSACPRIAPRKDK